MAKREGFKKEEHQHRFVQGYIKEERCCADTKCFKIQVSEEELEKRENEWNAYFQLVVTTLSYIEFMEAKSSGEAMRIEVAKKAKERMEKGDYLPKPTFADPIGQSWRYVGEENSELSNFDQFDPEVTP